MSPTSDLPFQLVVREGPEYAAKILAADLRERLRPRSLWPGMGASPLTSEDLRTIGRLRGVIQYEFGVPLSTEGLIATLPTGGFKVSVARGDDTGRARYTLAHEIGHTFFYDIDGMPPRRLAPYSRSPTAAAEVRTAMTLEEKFCNSFAAELLFPWDRAKVELLHCGRIEDTSELLAHVEDISRRWSISVELTLRRFNETYGVAANSNRIVSIMRWRPNLKTGREPGLRITFSLPRPCGNWFLPTNTRASSVGLFGADALFDKWQQFEHREPGRKYRRSGVFDLRYESGTPTILENEHSPAAPCIETLRLWRRSPEHTRWRRVRVQAPVTHRLYAANQNEAYAVALVNLSRASC